ncbi:hypothetical protein Agub_g12481, partial [Astrephomene gubernaculifera]
TAYFAIATTRSLCSAIRLARIAAAAPLPYDAADTSYSLTPVQQLALYCTVLLSWLALVAAPLSVTAGLITAASLWQVLSGTALFTSLLALSPRRASLSYILTAWRIHKHVSTVSSAPYNVLQTLLFPINGQTGYETVLYFYEEMLVHRRRRRSTLGKPASEASLAPAGMQRRAQHQQQQQHQQRRQQRTLQQHQRQPGLHAGGPQQLQQLQQQLHSRQLQRSLAPPGVAAAFTTTTATTTGPLPTDNRFSQDTNFSRFGRRNASLDVKTG